MNESNNRAKAFQAHVAARDAAHAANMAAKAAESAQRLAHEKLHHKD